MDITNFIKEIQPSQKQISQLKKIPKSFEKCLKKEFPYCKIHTFGSLVTGLYTQSSDVDMFLEYNYNLTDSSKDRLPTYEIRTRSDILEMLSEKIRIMKGTSEVYLISNAKVPIVTFKCENGHVRCDFSVKSMLAVHNSKLVKHCLNLNPKIMQTMILIKYIIFGRSNCKRLSKYAVTLLFLFYLQQPKVGLVPPINKLKKSFFKDYAEGWQVNFDQNYSHGWFSFRNITVKELLLGFFEYYSNFDFSNNVVCPFDGKVHDRELFKDFKFPASMKQYKRNMRKKPLGTDRPMCIQDFTELNNNVASSVTEITVYIVQFKQACYEIRNVYTASTSTLLSIMPYIQFRNFSSIPHYPIDDSYDDHNDDFLDWLGPFGDPGFYHDYQNPVIHKAIHYSGYSGLRTFGKVIFGIGALVALGYGISKLRTLNYAIQKELLNDSVQWQGYLLSTLILIKSTFDEILQSIAVD